MSLVAETLPKQLELELRTKMSFAHDVCGPPPRARSVGDPQLSVQSMRNGTGRSERGSEG